MSSDSKTPNRASIGVNTSTNTVPPSPSGLSAKRCVNGRQVFGFIAVICEDGPNISNVFGICKKEIKIGRGGQNDIRMNARQFSRRHCTIRIIEDGSSLQVRLTNESIHENATAVLPYVLPHGKSVLLESPSIFLLQGRRFKWLENGEYYNADSLEKSCGQSIVYLFEDSNQNLNNVVESSYATFCKYRLKSKKSPAGSPTSSPKKRRTSTNISLQLRKAAHSHNLRSSVQKLILCSPANSIANEDKDAVEEIGKATAPPGSSKVSAGMQSPPPRNVSLSRKSVFARTSAAPTRRSILKLKRLGKKASEDKKESAEMSQPKPKRLQRKRVKENERIARRSDSVELSRMRTRSQLNKIPSSEECKNKTETTTMEETKTEEHIKTTKAPVEAETSVNQSRTRKVKVVVVKPQSEVQVDTPKPKRLRKKAVEKNEGKAKMGAPVEVSRKRTRSQLNKIPLSEESNNEPELVITKKKKTREQSMTTKAPVGGKTSVKQSRTRKVKKVCYCC